MAVQQKKKSSIVGNKVFYLHRKLWGEVQSRAEWSIEGKRNEGIGISHHTY